MRHAFLAAGSVLAAIVVAQVGSAAPSAAPTARPVLGPPRIVAVRVASAPSMQAVAQPAAAFVTAPAPDRYEVEVQGGPVALDTKLVVFRKAAMSSDNHTAAAIPITLAPGEKRTLTFERKDPAEDGCNALDYSVYLDGTDAKGKYRITPTCTFDVVSNRVSSSVDPVAVSITSAEMPSRPTCNAPWPIRAKLKSGSDWRVAWAKLLPSSGGGSALASSDAVVLKKGDSRDVIMNADAKFVGRTGDFRLFAESRVETPKEWGGGVVSGSESKVPGPLTVRVKRACTYQVTPLQF